MSHFLTTGELETFIQNTYVKKLEEILNTSVELSGVFFSAGFYNSPEGTYIFCEDGEYQYLYTEKGNIRKHECTKELSQLVYWVMEDVIFDIAMEYATEYRGREEDFRRKLFEKELELWSILDQEGYKKKTLEIKALLEKNPYTS